MISKKIGLPFFDCDTALDLTVLQIRLIDWIEWYASFYDMSEFERPPNDEMEDDKKMDEWWDKKQKERKEEYLKSLQQQDKISQGVSKPRGKRFGSGKPWKARHTIGVE